MRQADEPAVVAAIATATAELVVQERDHDGCRRIVDEALERLAGTEDRRFRTELLVIALRNEADLLGPVPGRADPAALRRRDRLGAALAELAPRTDDDIDLAARHQTARNELARARAEATADDWAEAGRLWRTALRPARRRTACSVRRSATPAPDGGTRRPPRRRRRE